MKKQTTSRRIQFKLKTIKDNHDVTLEEQTETPNTLKNGKTNNVTSNPIQIKNKDNHDVTLEEQTEAPNMLKNGKTNNITSDQGKIKNKDNHDVQLQEQNEDPNILKNGKTNNIKTKSTLNKNETTKDKEPTSKVHDLMVNSWIQVMIISSTIFFL